MSGEVLTRSPDTKQCSHCKKYKTVREIGFLSEYYLCAPCEDAREQALDEKLRDERRQ